MMGLRSHLIREIDRGTLHAIFRQIGISPDDLASLILLLIERFDQSSCIDTAKAITGLDKLGTLPTMET